MSTNAERIEAYERFKRKRLPLREPSWMNDMRETDSGPPEVAYWIGIAAAVFVACLIGYGVVAHVTAEKPWALQVIEECERQGKVPHVDRDAQGAVLTVRCDLAR